MFSNIVRVIADPLFKRHVFCKKSTQFIDNPINDKEWFDNDCSQEKQRYMEAQRVFKRCKTDYSRNHLCMFKDGYKKSVKRKKTTV